MKSERISNRLFIAGLTVLAVLQVACNRSCNDSGPIRLNQLGFAPHQEKTATIDVDSLNAAPCEVFIIVQSSIVKSSNQSSNRQSSNQSSNRQSSNRQSCDTVWRGVASETMVNPVSGKFRQLVDFSDLTEEGDYILSVSRYPGIPVSHFTIKNHPFHALTRAALRAFYYQRASMDIVEPYAEGFARKAGHPDDQVIVHASAATAERPEGTVISSPGGWYDAGDYNKYIVNSGYTMGVWLMAYELNKPYFDTLHLNIPESIVNRQSSNRQSSNQSSNRQSSNRQSSNRQPSNRQCPDMLSEAMYNIRWMMTMQDLDGGVYHKLTTPNFEKFIRPDQCQQPRYVVLKTTAATLDFAATMALAARVYAPFDPDFCAQAEEAAKRAFAWAQEHPDIYYDQPALNEQFQPAITTGAYDDFDVQDEFYWAATELYLLTKDEAYQSNLQTFKPSNTAGFQPAVWGNVAELASLDLMMHGENKEFLSPFTSYLSPLMDEAETISVHKSPYGNREEDFFWGCNSEGCCWRGIECLYAYRLTGEEQYRINAERCLNNILGQNATGYCYVTGFGTKPTSYPHHRLSYSHPKGTHPGFLAGGPNRMRQDTQTDGVQYPENVPADESYLDEQPSYASNEVTINWNVTLFALTAGIDALEQ